MLLANKSRSVVYTNDLSAYNPTLWARESLMILRNNMVMAPLVHRDFEMEIASYGDIVNTRKPGDFSAKRKTSTDDVTVQDATGTNVPVKLNQHIHTSFMIKDEEMSKAFKDLVSEFLEPAVISLAQFVDQMVLGQHAQWLLNTNYYAGSLGAGSSKASIVETRQKMTENKCPLNIRNLAHSPASEADLLNIAEFLNADKIGDDGTKMREASLGRLLGFNHWVDQNASQINTPDTDVGAVNNTEGYAAGSTTIAVDGFSAVIPAGAFFTVAGDGTPQRVVSTVGGTTPTSITFTPGLVSAVADDAVVTVVTPGAVNESAGYAANYAKEISYDGFTANPQVGQALAFGTASDLYTVLQVDISAGTILLDRPLDAAIVDDAAINLVPQGNYNLAWHRNAIALVIRPLALPRPETGVRGAAVNAGGFTMRSVLTYDGRAQGTLVTLDFLAGIKVLDLALGCLMFS